MCLYIYSPGGSTLWWPTCFSALSTALTKFLFKEHTRMCVCVCVFVCLCSQNIFRKVLNVGKYD